MIELSGTNASAIAERFKALGEPMRLLLLEALRRGECSVGELAERTGAGSSPQPRRGSHPKRRARPRIRSSGQNPVRLDWKRLKPTNAVKTNHAGFTQTPSATDAITKSPAIRRISASLHILNLQC